MPALEEASVAFLCASQIGVDQSLELLLPARARLRFEVEIPRVLTVESVDGRSRISTNNGTTLGQCNTRNATQGQGRCSGSGVGSSGLNEWEAPRGMTAVAQP